MYPTVYHPLQTPFLDDVIEPAPAAAEAGPAAGRPEAAEEPQRRRRARRWGTRLGRVGVGLGWLVVLGAAAIMVVPTLLGYDRYVIVSGSMRPGLDRGSIVYAKAVDAGDLHVGDVITYQPPIESGVTHLVTHRISSITATDEGTRVFRTKGDANPGDDPWVFQLDGARQNTMRFSVPYLGHVLLWMANPHTRMVVIGVPAGIIALLALLELLGLEPRRRVRSQAA